MGGVHVSLAALGGIGGGLREGHGARGRDKRCRHDDSHHLSSPTGSGGGRDIKAAARADVFAGVTLAIKFVFTQINGTLSRSRDCHLSRNPYANGKYTVFNS
jgi:hypothetical protein